MKVGDVVISNKVRPSDKATIVKVNVKIVFNEKKNRKETRTEYVAEFPDKSTYTFYGFNVNKSVFKAEEPDGQLCLDDFINMPET